jgi:hypothetical protein
MPYFRFEPWGSLSSTYLAEQVGYTADTWSHPGENEIEGKSYASIENVYVLDQMGFTQYTWDCWVNHYTDYTWEELQCYGLSSAFKSLGWDETSWESENEDDWPEQEFTDWELLYDSEKKAAKRLCYFPEMWNSENISGWESDWDSEISPASCRSSICSIRTFENEGNFCCEASACDKDTITSPVPYFKFEAWEELDSAMKVHAEVLGYTDETWNSPGKNKIESISYAYIEDKESIDKMGFTQHTWDCWVNHYSNYTWEELECFGLSYASEALGWDESSWKSKNEDDWPEQEFTNWTLLHEDEQLAAEEMCFFPELWDQIRLSKWGSKWDSSLLSKHSSVSQSSSSAVGELATAATPRPTEISIGNVFVN